jgi:hypothetical protein
VTRGFEKVAIFATDSERCGAYGYVVKLMRRRHTGSAPVLPDLIPPLPFV